MEKIILFSSDVFLSEENSNPDSYIAKFIICGFERNKNGVSLDRATIDTWLSTLKNKPLVGKIKMHYDGEYDFTSHNVKKIEKTDENGNTYQEVEFDTEAFGSFFDVSIETINDREFIIASCEIWKRFSRACEIIIKRIQEGNLSTSWEIAVEKSVQGIVDGLMTKIIQTGRFIGHCLLGKRTSPAYSSSGLLEIASTGYDVEFAEALSNDCMSQYVTINETLDLQEKKEDTFLIDKDDTLTSETISIEPEFETKNNIISNAESEISALTSRDLREKISKACRDKHDHWCWVAYLFPEEHEVWCEYDGESELDYLKFTYSVENDEVTVSDPEKMTLTVSVRSVNTVVSEYEKTIAEKDELIIKASSEITTLKADNTELSQYKEKFTIMEQEKVTAELEQKKTELVASLVKSGQMTKDEIEESEELSGYVNGLDKKSLMAIIGERLLSAVSNQTQTVETSAAFVTKPVLNLNNEDEEIIDKAALMRKFLGK